MQDNDLPQIGTPMQTDETRVEVIPADRDAAAKLRLEASPSGSSARVFEEIAAEHFARHRAAFAAPPAVERERNRWRFARYLNGVRMAEGVAVTLADDLDTAISKAVGLCPKAPAGCQILVLTHAKGSPALHPSDREAIAREVKRMRESAKAWRRPALRQVEGPNDLKIYGGTIADDIDKWADMLCVGGIDRLAMARIIDPRAFPSVGCTILSDELGRLADQLGIGSPATKALAKADAILALSGSLAPQGGEHPLARMVALDEEIEAEHPGWMTGIATEKGATK